MIYMYSILTACVRVCARARVHRVCRGQKRASGPVELELQVVVTHHVSAENLIPVFQALKH